MPRTLALLVLVGCPLPDKADTAVDSADSDEAPDLTFDPSDPWLLLLGDSPGDEFGAHAAPLGDIDGDGDPELVVAAPGAGSAYVFFSRTIGRGGEFHASDADVTIRSDLPIAPGAEVADAGDIDGDGLSDLLVRSTGFVDYAWRGQVSLYFGSGLASGGERLLSAADAQIGWFDGDTYAMDVDGALIAAGDVDGDGLGDIWVGCPEVASRGGKLFRVPGSTLQLGGQVEVADLPNVYSTSRNTLLGAAAAAGDVDGDGVNDVIVTAPGAWPDIEAWVVYATTFLADESVDRELADVVFRYPPRDVPQLTTGLPVRMGDVDADGLADLVLGEPRWSRDTAGPLDTAARSYPSGRVSIFYASTLENGEIAVNDADARIEATGSALGRRLGTPAEVTGDGRVDPLVSARVAAFVFDGTTLPPETVLLSSDAWQDWSISGVKVIESFDLAGDGRADVILGGYERPYDETGWVMVLAQ